jgi:hypothetical protein
VAVRSMALRVTSLLRMRAMRAMRASLAGLPTASRRREQAAPRPAVRLVVRLVLRGAAASTSCHSSIGQGAFGLLRCPGATAADSRRRLGILPHLRRSDHRDLKPLAGVNRGLTILGQPHVRSMRPWESLSRQGAVSKPVS